VSFLHPVSNSKDFRAGMAYAAHLIETSIGIAHGGTEATARAELAKVEPRRCCQDAMLGFALGMIDGLHDGAGRRVEEHTHYGDAS
jgi:hypothetical protein